MAKKRDETDSWLIQVLYVLIIVALILLTAFVYLPPIAILVAVVFYEYESKRVSQSFDLEKGERRKLSNLERRLAGLREQHAEIEAKGAHLKKRVDGYFHEGSGLGMELNAEKNALLAEGERLKGQHWSIRIRPYFALKRWMRVASWRNSLRWTLACYLSVWVSSYFVAPAFVQSAGHFVGQHILIRIGGFGNTTYGAAVMAAIASCIMLPFAYMLSSQREKAAHYDEFENAEMLKDEVPPTYLAYEIEDQDDEGEDEEETYEGYDEDGVFDDYEDEYEDDEYGINKEGDEEEDEDEQPGRSCYEILGIDASASVKEIKVAYHAKIKQYHPDVVARAAPEIRDFANEQAKIIQAAYEEALGKS